MTTLKWMAPWLLVVAAATCGDSRSDRYFDGDTEPDSYCRENPGDCFGEIGGRCDVTDDCDQGVCCREEKNCDRGMCLFTCNDDRDCPINQRCEHDFCFFSCNDDRDCGAGQSCEHGKTVCEYP